MVEQNRTLPDAILNADEEIFKRQLQAGEGIKMSGK